MADNPIKSPPTLLSMSIWVDGTVFNIHILDDERGHAIRREWLLYFIDAILPTMNAATVFQVRVP